MLLLFFKFCTRFKSGLCTYIRTLHNSKFLFLPLRRSFTFLSCFCCCLSSICFNLKDALQPFFFQPVCFLLILQWSDLDHVLPRWSQPFLSLLLCGFQILLIHVELAMHSTYFLGLQFQGLVLCAHVEFPDSLSESG